VKLNLVTCNIRFDNPADGPNAWTHRRLFLSEILRSHGPDILATQEGRFDQLRDLEQLLEDYELYDHHRSWIKERMYPTFFLKKGCFETLQGGDLWLSETPDIAGSLSFGSAFPRLMTWLKVQPIDKTEQLLLVNTHLDHVKRETRIEQCRVLIKEVKKIMEPKSKLIVMGDFNDDPASEVRLLFETSFPGIQDSWRLHHQTEESSHHAFQGEVPNGSRIDWILVDSAVPVLSSHMDKSVREGKYPTDHYPIISQIKL
jgi:endonuclease/exonuclease/phosphatase family metal-dependent hydrolase